MLIQSSAIVSHGFIGQAGKSAVLGCWNVESFLRCLTWNSILCGIYLYAAQAATAACHYYFFHRSLSQNKRPRPFSAPSRHLVINQKGHDMTSAAGHVFRASRRRSLIGCENKALDLKSLPLRCFNYGDKWASRSWTHDKERALTSWPLFLPPTTTTRCHGGHHVKYHTHTHTHTE